jgi:natural product biosynthesis luciferase-like monooxygenase protein/amino acid adenylation domain-containing protein
MSAADRSRGGAATLPGASTAGDLSPAKQELLSKLRLGAADQGPAPIPRRGAVAAPLSFAQERLWFLDQLAPGAATYNMPAAVQLSGPLAVPALASALAAIVARHEALRTRFAVTDGGPVQLVDPDLRAALPRIDLATLPAGRREGERRRLTAAAARRPFDLAAGPLLRTLLLVCGPARHVLVCVMHHIVSDGWSIGVFVRELAALYTAFAAGRPPPLAPLPIQYADFAVWQRQELRGESLESLLAYWRSRLAGAPDSIELPTDRTRSAADPAPGGSLERRPARPLHEELAGLCRAEEATLFMGLLAGFAAILGRYSGQQDLVIGSPIANRNRRETEGLIGFFVNTLALRIDLSGEPSFRQLLARVREATLTAYDHQDLPFERLVEELRPDRSLARSPLFQVMFVLQNGPLPARLADLDLELLDLRREVAAFDLTLSAGELSGEALWEWEYRRDLFDGGSVARLSTHLENLLGAVLREPDRALAELPLAAAAERHQVLYEWSRAAEPPGAPELFQTLFEAQVTRSRQQLALVDAASGESLTYGELNAAANRLAWSLRGLGIGPEARVGLAIERSAAMIVAMLAVLKAGGAYVPIDPDDPAERREAIRRAAGLALCLDAADAARLAVGSPADPRPGALPQSTAYVVFTSGSTGRPKGVAVSHAALAWYARQGARAYGFGAEERVLQLSSLSFDTSVEEIFCAFAHGARLVLRDREAAASIAELYRLCERQGITSLHPPTAFWHEMAAEPLPAPGCLRRVVIGGEAALAARVAAWQGRYAGKPQLFNSYGPSEATVVAAVAELPAAAGAAGAGVAMGRPIPGVEVYLLDDRLCPVPPGVPGELYLGGAGVARGYLGQSDETARRFVPHPFASRAGARLYRTGDLARFRPDGALVFRGRLDAQVKIRGFRIEPQEVEAALAVLPGVRQSAVVAQESPTGVRLLIAFAALAPGAPPADLLAALGARLPGYLVPSRVVLLEALPLLPGGKIDRRALAALPLAAESSGRSATPAEAAGHRPDDPGEELLLGIWSEVLGVGPVPRHASFFALGGHSLLATQVISRVRKVFGIELPVRRFFEAPTIAALARFLAEARQGEAVAPPICRAPRGGPMPLSFAQQRLWFLDQLTPGMATYNLPSAVEIRGPLAVWALARALRSIIARHEALRTRFLASAGVPFQKIDPAAVPAALLRIDLSALPPGRRGAERQRLIGAEAERPFDLAAGPLIRTLLVACGPARHVLVCVMHHIVSDGWSLGVFSRELAAIYAAFATGCPSPLAPLAIQYADFAVWQRQHLAGSRFDRQVEFWRRSLAGAPELLELPTDRGRPAVRSYRGAQVPLAVPRDVTAALSALAQRRGATLFMVALAAFQVLLIRYSCQEEVFVGSPIANRNQADTEELIGFFVNTLVFRGGIEGSPTFLRHLARLRDQALDAYAHQDVPFERIVEELSPRRSLAHSPLFQAFFALQNAPGPVLALPGLEIALLPLPSLIAKFDLAVSLEPAVEGLGGFVEYSLDLFDRATAVRVAGHFRTLLGELAGDPDRAAWEVSLLSDEEREQIRSQGERSLAPYPRQLTIDRLIAAQVERTPEAVAAACGDRRLTYGELAARAGALARRLRTLGVGPDTVVGLAVERSLEMIVGLVSILAAGGAYLPLDAAYPRQRLAAMLADGGTPVLLVQRHLAGLAAAAPAGCAVLQFDEDGAAGVDDSHDGGDGGEVFGSLPRVEPDCLAYVLFTSGSTGRPKGVQVCHRSLVNLLAAMGRGPGPWAGDVVMAVSTLSFDIASFELLAALTAGARLEIAPAAAVADGGALAAMAAACQPTFLQATPASWRLLLESGWRGEPGMRLLSGGEAMPRDLADRLLALPGKPAGLWNYYGPTEAAVYATGGRVLPGAVPVTIGSPIANTVAYVLDCRGQPVAFGVAGELCLGGDGLARGYAGQPALTAARFVPDPCGAAPGGRLYRTGDQARPRADGTIDLIGRLDHQVKLRGFRIELGEIEAALHDQPGVARAVAMAREDRPGDHRIAAYVVPAAGQIEAVDLVALAQALRLRLPSYMLPADIVVLAALPLTPNGKIDRRALPAPAVVRSAAADGERCRTPWEELVGGAFAEVLGREDVGRGASFFDLGGHSLLATQVVSRMRELAGAPVPLAWLFELPTVAAFAARLEAAAGTLATRLPPIRVAPRDRPLALSFAQERLWFLDRLQPGGGAYNLFQAVRLEGEIDAGALRRGLAGLERRHEALRTVFSGAGGEPRQVVRAGPAAALGVVDLRRVDAGAECRRLSRAEAVRPFDLERGPLVRWLLLRRGDEDHVLLANLHHAVADGWSMGVLLREVAELYRAGVERRAPRLAELPVQYADYAAWQREEMSGEVLAAEIAFWRERLAGAPQSLELPADRPRPAAQSVRGAAVQVRLGRGLVADLERLARRCRGTLFMTLLSGFDTLLARHSGQQDLLVGVPVANRTRREVEGLIGLFVNTLVLRADLAGSPGAAELVGRTRDRALAAYAHQDLPFERLVEEIAPARNLAQSVLFQAMLALQNTPLPAIDLGGVRLSLIEEPSETSKFDLTLTLTPAGGELRGALEYRTDLFDAVTVRRLGCHLEALLAAACRDPDRVVWELPMLAGGERAQLVREWNDTAAEVPADLCLEELLAERAARWPDRVALALGDERLTYRELEAGAERLADRLERLGVGPDRIAGICLERSLEMVVGMLAVLKAGGAYLPLDPSYPEERLLWMLGDSGASVLLTSSAQRQRLGGFAGAVVCLDGPSGGLPHHARAGARPDRRHGRRRRRALPANLAYVMYTSGSTGRPKAAMIPHAALVNHMLWMQRRYPLGAGDRVLQKTPVSFDASVWEFYAPLLVGGCLVLARPGAHRDPAYLAAVVADGGVSVLQVVPTLLDLLLAEPRWRDCRSLRRVFCGGEALTVALQRRFFARLDVELVNVYGPTEATIHASSWTSRAAGQPLSATIGVPIDNGAVYLLDRHGAPVPVGVPGELFVGGANVGRGYHGRPDLTAERFVPDPFAETPGARLYATGDLARTLPTGRLDFLGRRDHQVKLRGVRIDLGEIESQLLDCAGVQRAVVALLAAPERQDLVAYVVPAAAGEISIAALRERLRAALPDSMVPTFFVVLDRLPLLPNGKVDRRALPAPDRAGLPGGGGAAAGAAEPRTPMEATLLELWAEVLERRDLGIHDDFFDAGGHSLLAARLAWRLRDLLGVEVPLLTLFAAPTVAGLAARLQALRGELRPAGPPIVPGPRSGPLPLSSGQERLWFLHALQPGSAAYHLPLACRLRGDLDAACLSAALAEIERRHEILRTVYRVPAERPVQLVLAAGGGEVPRVDLAGLPEPRRAAAARRLAEAETARPFDLETGPVWRALLLRLAARDHVLVLTQHHIASDGWSTRLLLGELTRLYEAAVERRPSPLAELPIQYADFARWQRDWLGEEALERQLAYWRQQLAGAPALLALPTDRPRPAVASARGGEVELALPAELAAALRGCGRARGATLFMALLAGFQILLARTAGQRDVLVGTPVTGRNRGEVEGLVGLFANTLVMRTTLAPEATFADVLAAVRAVALAAFDHQELPFEKLVEALQPRRDLGIAPIFQVFFSLQHLALPRFALRGLDVGPFAVEAGGARFDLTLEVMEEPAGLAARFEYGADLFDRATVLRLAGQWRTLLKRATAAPELRLTEVSSLSEAERHQLAAEWNDTGLAADGETSIARLFERQADLTPERQALIADGEVLTYRDLDRRADRLAQRLSELGTGPDTLVALCLPRSAELVVGMLAVLKAGGAYVPLDPEYPAERLAYMLQDCGARLLVAQSPAILGMAAADVLVVDPAALPAAAAETRRSGRSGAPGSLAYVIYTSGSSGRPKGVMVPGSGVVNFFRGMDERIGGAAGLTWLAVTSMSFDISVLEILWTLTRGFRVVLGRETPAHLRAAEQAAQLAARPVDFSLFFFASEERQDDPQKYRLLEAAARFGDEHGWKAVWTPERHFHAFGGLYPNPAVIGAALAAWTRRIEIRAGSVVLPLHHPVRVAEEWSIVDNLSGGRVGISFASGWHPDDFVFSPASYARRKEIMFEGIETVRRLWRGEAVAGVSGSGLPVEVRIRPRPVQAELPVWVTAAGSPETFAMAGRIGAHVLTHLLGQDVDVLAANVAAYRLAWRPAAGGAREGRVSLMLHAFAGDDLEAVRAQVKVPFTNYLRTSVGLLRGLAASQGRDMDAAAFTEDDLAALLEHAFTRYFDTSSLFGTPASCGRMVERLRAAGIDEIACLIDFGVEVDAVIAGLRSLEAVRAAAERPAAPGGDPSLAGQAAHHGVTHLQCTPSMAGMLAMDPAMAATLGRLERLLLGGEPLPPALLERLQESVPGEIHNLYGPTETTVWSTSRRMRRRGGGVTLGRAIANTTLRLLDPSGQPVPIGVAGELHIAGAGVVRGYLGRPDLTAARFVPDPWSERGGERLYRTGDLARLLPDGDLEFLGRADQQVKLRGFRIELEEIEVALCRHPAVSEAVVTVREDTPGDRRLVGYYVAGQGSAPSAAALRELLAASLPDYMVPAALVRLERLPLTPNRKVDRQALPAVAMDAGVDGGAAPRGELEALVASVWTATLHLERAGIHDNFFEMGGHSLLAAQLLVRLRAATGRDLPLRAVFEAPTIAGLAERLLGAADMEAGIARPPLVAVPRRDLHPLSYAQQRLFILDQITPDTWAYNDQGAVLLRGALDLAALGRSLGEIVRRHESLRTGFVLVAGRPMQVVRPAAGQALPIVDLSSLSPARRTATLGALVREQSRHVFELASEPLLRLCLLRLAPAEHALSLVVHHVIWDGWSLVVFVRELTALYNALARGLPSPLPELPVQYVDFAEWQLSWLDETLLASLIAFWREELEGAPQILQFPCDRPRPPVQSFRGRRHGFELDAELAAALRALCRREGVTLFMTLLAGFEALLGQRCGQEDFLVGTDVANRNAVETEALVGFFVNQVVLRSDLRGDPTFRELLERTRRRALAAFAHQDLPFDWLAGALQQERDPSRTPLFQVKLVLQNVPRDAAAMAGVELLPLELGWESAKFDLLLNLTETADGISGSMEYSTDLFNLVTVERLCAAYGQLLARVVAEPSVRLSDLARALSELEESARAADRGERGGRSLDRMRRVRRTRGAAAVGELAAVEELAVVGELAAVGAGLPAAGGEADE